MPILQFIIFNDWFWLDSIKIFPKPILPFGSAHQMANSWDFWLSAFFRLRMLLLWKILLKNCYRNIILQWNICVIDWMMRKFICLCYLEAESWANAKCNSSSSRMRLCEWMNETAQENEMLSWGLFPKI